MEKYQCSRCKKWVEWKDIDVYHFKSVYKPHTLLLIQMCLECRDAVFDFIEKRHLTPAAPDSESDATCTCDGLSHMPTCPLCGIDIRCW